jgi:hypothetical protein
MFRVVKGRETLIKIFSIYERKRNSQECVFPTDINGRGTPDNECVSLYEMKRNTAD